MRIVVTGATGNVGTSLLRRLGEDPRVDSILGIARRLPRVRFPKTSFAAADVARDELEPLFHGADAVVHLAWIVQPSRDRETLQHVNVDGSARVFRAAADAGVGALVHASSVGVYAPGRGLEPVDESWPLGGVPGAWYAEQKAEVERRLDAIEAEFPSLRIVRLRPALVMKREAAGEVRRLFVGPLVPPFLLRRLPLVPDVPGLKLQVVHSDDVAEAYRLAALEPAARGAYNVATQPPLVPARLAALLGARRVPVSAALARGVTALAWRARLQPTPPDWIDLALRVPVLDAGRIERELGWRPSHTAEETVLDLVRGFAERAGLDTPPLDPGRARGPGSA
jgi:nucleoside-diphosphate-sugar epimerase